jgi:hypothetical protein
MAFRLNFYLFYNKSGKAMKRLSFVTVFLLFSLLISIQGQTCIWAEKIAGAENENIIGIATDTCDNLYLAGEFSSDTLTFNNGLNLTKSSTFNGYIAKYNPDGKCQWAEKITCLKSARLYDIKADRTGFLYITGKFHSDTLKFNNGKFLTNSEGNFDNRFLAKYDDSGNCQWAKIIDTYYFDKFTVDNTGNIYFPMRLNSDSYILKYNSEGEKQWEKKISEGSIVFEDIVVGFDENIFLSGYYGGTVTFNNGNIITEDSCKNDYSPCVDAFVAMFNSTGICQWSKNISGNLYDVVKSLAFDQSKNIIIAGGFNSDTVRFNDEIFLSNENSEDKWGSKYFNAFLAMLDSSGVFKWIKEIEGDQGELADKITTDSDGNIFVSGNFDSKTLNFGNGRTLTKKYDNDFESVNTFLGRYDSSGGCRWVDKISGYYGLVYNKGLALLEDNLLMTGTFTTSVLSFNNEITLENSTGDFWGPNDVFLAKYTPAISISLSSGWNMISANVIPKKPEIDSIFSKIKEKIIIVKNENGYVYIPGYGINTIGEWKFAEGYQIYSTEDTVLFITGSCINPENEDIFLVMGWHIVAYLGSEPQSAVDALKSLTDAGVLVIVKDSNGNAYIPAFGINNIGDMQPGQGYQMYLDDNGTLTYPAE